MSSATASFLPGLTAIKLVVGVIAAIALTGGCIAAVLVLVNDADWWRGLLAATVTTVVASALSMLPLIWGIRRSLDKAVIGYFVSMGVRAGASVGVSLLAVFVIGYPRVATLLLMAVYYVAVLAVEAGTVAIAAWNASRRAT